MQANNTEQVRLGYTCRAEMSAAAPRHHCTRTTAVTLFTNDETVGVKPFGALVSTTCLSMFGRNDKSS